MLLCGASVVLGCGGEDQRGASGAASGNAKTAAEGSATGSVAASSSPPPAQQSAAGGPATAPATNPLAGTWKGSYRAEKVAPTLDPTVKDEVWRDDDGTRHAGAGRIELTVAPDGTTSGVIDGALGAGDLHGVTDDGMVRATIAPRGQDAAAGTLTGRPADKGLAVELRTSDGAGKTPRIARATLEKVP